MREIRKSELPKKIYFIKMDDSYCGPYSTLPTQQLKSLNNLYEGQYIKISKPELIILNSDGVGNYIKEISK